ncbi:MAG: winged helix-turn-helix domain-containing protein, partial [Candidatus Adiutricales bacterium]
RPPADKSAQPLNEGELDRIKKFFGSKTQVAGGFEKKRPEKTRGGTREEILQLVGRRPCGVKELASALGLPREEVRTIVQKLRSDGMILQEVHADDIFFRRV